MTYPVCSQTAAVRAGMKMQTVRAYGMIEDVPLGRFANDPTFMVALSFTTEAQFGSSCCRDVLNMLFKRDHLF